MTEWRLNVGKKFTGVVVRSDDKWPTMYRVHWPDAPPSNMVNLTRAKDAARRWIASKGGTNRGTDFNWRLRESRRGRGLVRQNDPALVG